MKRASLASGCLLAWRCVMMSPLEAQRPPGDRSDRSAVATVADSADAIAWYDLAMARFGRDRVAAEADLRRAVRIDPHFAEAWLALALVRADDAPAAAAAAPRRFFARAVLLDPFLDIRLIGAVGAGGSVHADVSLALAEGRYADAVALLGVALDRGPVTGNAGSTVLLWFRGMAAARAGQLDQAIADFERVRQAAVHAADSSGVLPLGDIDYRYVLAALHQRAGRLEEAASLYRQVLDDDLGNFMAHVQLARIHELRGEQADAVVERERAVAVAPDDAALLYDLGVALGRAGRTAEAFSAIERAAAANPLDPRPYYWLGAAEAGRRHFDAARTAYMRFISLAPVRFSRQVAHARQQLAALP